MHEYDLWDEESGINFLSFITLFPLYTVTILLHMYNLYVSEMAGIANRHVLLQPSICGSILTGLNRRQTYER